MNSWSEEDENPTSPKYSIAQTIAPVNKKTKNPRGIHFDAVKAPGKATDCQC